MLRLLKRFLSSNRGQAFPLVLAVLALGGLTIAASVSYAATGLRGSQIVEESVKGIYAAEAGAEYGIWRLKNGVAPPEDETQSFSLPETINRMAVNIETKNLGTYTLYLGGMLEVTSPHATWVGVGSNITWDAARSAWKYTITVTWQAPHGETPRKLDFLGARLPVGYQYRADLPVTASDDITGNMQSGYPKQEESGSGAYLVNWKYGPSAHDTPEVSEDVPVRTQSFYISHVSGSGSLEGNYAWLVAQTGDVGTVSEITGTRYKITSTATRQDGKGTTTIAVDLIKESGGLSVTSFSWQIR